MFRRRRQRESAQLWKQEPKELKFYFSRCSSLVWKELSCLPACLSIWTRCGLTLWTVSQRHPEASPSICSHIWPPRPPRHLLFFPPPPLLLLLSTLFFSLITNTCGLCFHQLLPSRQSAALLLLLFPLSSALWHAGGFISPKRSLNFGLSFAEKEQQQQRRRRRWWRGSSGRKMWLWVKSSFYCCGGEMKSLRVCFLCVRRWCDLHPDAARQCPFSHLSLFSTLSGLILRPVPVQIFPSIHLSGLMFLCYSPNHFFCSWP